MSADPNASSAHSASTGVLIMLLGMLMFALNDVLGKWLVSTYSLGQVVLVRSLAALLVLSPFLLRRNAVRNLVRVERPWLQAARVAFSTAELFAFYFAVTYLPLADVMTYWLAAPIYIAALSPLLLGEHVGWRRWTAIAIGFVGVLIALEPSSASFTWPAVLSLAGSVAFAFMMVSGRSLRGTPDMTLVFWQVAGAGLIGLIAAPFDWVALTVRDALLLGLLGIVAMLAHMLINRALKLADAAAVAPLQYTLLFWGIVFGWVVFGDIPRPMMLVGAGFIIASGLFIVLREQQLRRQGRLNRI